MRRPVSNGGPDRTVAAGSVVQLDGSASSDIDGDLLTFTWSFISRPAGSMAVLSDTRAVKPTFLADVKGTYVIQLIVNDGNVNSDPKTVVVSTENTAPVAKAGPDQTVSVGGTVQLDGAGSFDPNGDPLNFNWSLVSKPTGSATTLIHPSSPKSMFLAAVAGVYLVQLVVNDGSVNSAPDTVKISTANSRPVASAGINQTVPPGKAVQLDGRASSDPDGDPLTFRWSLTARPSGSSTVLPDSTDPNRTFVPDTPGVYVAQLIVND